MWTISAMGKTRNVQFAVPQGSELGQALDILMARFPGLGNSLIWRKIFELGMPVLAADPDLMRLTTTPKPEEMTEEYQRQLRQSPTALDTQIKSAQVSPPPKRRRRG